MGSPPVVVAMEALHLVAVGMVGMEVAAVGDTVAMVVMAPLAVDTVVQEAVAEEVVDTVGMAGVAKHLHTPRPLLLHIAAEVPTLSVVLIAEGVVGVEKICLLGLCKVWVFYGESCLACSA